MQDPLLKDHAHPLYHHGPLRLLHHARAVGELTLGRVLAVYALDVFHHHNIDWEQ